MRGTWGSCWGVVQGRVHNTAQQVCNLGGHARLPTHSSLGLFGLLCLGLCRLQHHNVADGPRL